MVIQHNMLAMNANRQFGINTGKTRKTTEKLSSGYKINRAADDAAGLSISEKMRRQIRGLSQSAENIQDGIGYVQTADGALNEAHDILQRMNELAVKSANGTNTEEDREYIDSEVQQLKEELDRIFSTTSFNDKLIWDPDEMDKVQIGSEYLQAAEFRTTPSSIDITNANCGVVATNGYKINADDQGVNVTWTGYDGNAYATEKIDWATLESNNYSFEMSDYFGADDGNNALYNNGSPVLKHKISLSVQETATVDDIIASIDGTYMSSYAYAPIYARFEDSTGASTTGDMYVSGTSSAYAASYVSSANGTQGVRNFDGADDAFIEAADNAGNKLANGSSTGNVISSPSATTVADAQNSTEGWTLSFVMDGVGKVTATSNYVSYAAPSDTAADDEGHWWEWSTRRVNGVTEKYKAYKERTISGGTLGDVMSALTGAKGTATPGILSGANGGAANNGGYIELHFDMKADTPYTYGNGVSSQSVGGFSLRLNVSDTDTEESVLKKIKDSLNGTSIIDFYTNNSGSDSGSIYTADEKTNKIEVPIWGGTKRFFVQAGTEAGQHIDVTYDCLSVRQLELHETNVLTVEDSEKAIDEIKSAIQQISSQRSTFGAYQNRLEHSYNVNKNTEENTQASESVIRDTDMAKTMVEHSGLNILLQAGQAMMAQANQANQSVLQLLQ